MVAGREWYVRAHTQGAAPLRTESTDEADRHAPRTPLRHPSHLSLTQPLPGPFLLKMWVRNHIRRKTEQGVGWMAQKLKNMDSLSLMLWNAMQDMLHTLRIGRTGHMVLACG